MDRIKMIKTLANSLRGGGNYEHDDPIEAVIKALLEDDECVVVETTYPDRTVTHCINYNGHLQRCVAVVQRSSSKIIEGGHQDWD